MTKKYLFFSVFIFSSCAAPEPAFKTISDSVIYKGIDNKIRVDNVDLNTCNLSVTNGRITHRDSASLGILVDSLPSTVVTLENSRFKKTMKFQVRSLPSPWIYLYPSTSHSTEMPVSEFRDVFRLRSSLWGTGRNRSSVEVVSYRISIWNCGVIVHRETVRGNTLTKPVLSVIDKGQTVIFDHVRVKVAETNSILNAQNLTVILQ